MTYRTLSGTLSLYSLAGVTGLRQCCIVLADYFSSEACGYWLGLGLWFELGFRFGLEIQPAEILIL